VHLPASLYILSVYNFFDQIPHVFIHLIMASHVLLLLSFANLDWVIHAVTEDISSYQKSYFFYSWCISSNLVWLSLIDPALHSLICPCSMESNTLFQLYHILNIQCRYVFWYYLIQVNDQSNQWSNMIYMIKFFVYLCIKTFF